MKIVFEKLTRSTALVAACYLLAGHDVYCLSVSQKCKASRLLTRGVFGRRVELLEILPSLGMHLYEAHRLAFENVEDVFRRSGSTSRVIQLLSGLFEDPAVEIAFKKELNRELFQFYSINYIGSVLEKHFAPDEFCFIPSRGEYPYFFDGVDRYVRLVSWLEESGAFQFPNSRMRVPFWIRGWNYLMEPVGRAIWLLKQVAVLGLLLARYVAGPKKGLRRRESRYGITVIAPARQFDDRIQGIDFLVDGELIKKEEVVIVSGETLRDQYRRVLQDRGLDYVEMCRAGWDRAAIARSLPVALRLLWRGWREMPVIRGTALVLVLHYCKWKSFVNKVTLRNLVTHCDMELEAIPRNILLKKQGAVLWYYMDSINFPCYFAQREEEFDKYLHYRAGFLYYDHFISWSDQVSNYFRLHRQAISQYVTVGCLWAEQSRKILEGAIRSGLRDVVGPKVVGNEQVKVLGVFDSSFLDWSPTPYRDGIGFVAGILRLLDEIPDVFVVLKEKKARNFPTHPADIIELYDRLERHPRCHATSPKQNSSEVIALSDLVIAFPFTSVGFEALTIGKRAVYFCGGGTLGPSYYDRVPGLVCRGYDELVGRIRELLWDVSDEQYEKYLDTYVRGEIVPKCNGRALTRFREMLAGSTLTGSR